MATEELNQASVTRLPTSRDGDERITEIRKNIIIIMPFGGSRPDSERRYRLEYKRLKYLIENHIRVPSNQLNEMVRYDVNVGMARVNEITKHAFDLIADADVVLALLTEKNVNVIYELAIRNLIRPAFLLIVKGDPEDVLPIYMRNMPFTQYEVDDDLDSQTIRNAIDRLASNKDHTITWHGSDIPAELAEVVDRNDIRLIADIQEKLTKIEESPLNWPDHLQQLAGDNHPGRLFDNWSSYNPACVIRVMWRRKSDPLRYDPEDIIGEPVVYSINHDFATLFDFKYEAFPEPDGPEALTVGRLLKRLDDYIDTEHMKIFVDDQIRVANVLIFDDRDGRAKIPLQFNNRHPKLANQVYLPCVVGKRTIGRSEKNPHATYLHIVYIEDFYPIDEPSVRSGKGE